MAGVYELIGRIVVGFIRIRYGKQLRAAAAIGLIAAIAAGYLLSDQEVREG